MRKAWRQSCCSFCPFNGRFHCPGHLVSSEDCHLEFGVWLLEFKMSGRKLTSPPQEICTPLFIGELYPLEAVPNEKPKTRTQEEQQQRRPEWGPSNKNTSPSNPRSLQELTFDGALDRSAGRTTALEDSWPFGHPSTQTPELVQPAREHVGAGSSSGR